jgi:hypothetical protein
MSGGDFHDFSDDELAASNFFDFSNSADTLQSLESIGAADHKVFLSPQELTASVPFPDSPNGSYHDSSSESASSTKRTASCSTSSKTPITAGDVAMEEANSDKMEWGQPNFAALDADDSFAFGRTADSSGVDGLYTFGDHDDSFMDQSFDFESASSSPDAPSTGHMTTMASPGMTTIKNHSPRIPDSAPRGKSYTHKKQSSVRTHIFYHVSHFGSNVRFANMIVAVFNFFITEWS